METCNIFVTSRYGLNRLKYIRADVVIGVKHVVVTRYLVDYERLRCVVGQIIEV